MVFSSLLFLYAFLPVCLLLYFLVPGLKGKNIVLLCASLVFYAWGEPVYVFLMLAVAALNWGFGLLLGKKRSKGFGRENRQIALENGAPSQIQSFRNAPSRRNGFADTGAIYRRESRS